MGNRTSKSQQNTGLKPPGPLNKGFFKPNQPGMILPPRTSEFSYLEFIFKKPPVKVANLPQQTQTNQSINYGIFDKLKREIILYNKTWNFGNQSNGPQSFKEQTYDSFLGFVTNLLTNPQFQNSLLPQGMTNLNGQSFQAKKEIVKKIHEILQGNYGLVNKTFDVKISDIFPNIGQNYYVEVNLLDLASIIGAEHIVIYLLMCGAVPDLSNTANKDSATLMLEYQIILYKLFQSQKQSLSFIILPRILYVLFLLGSVKDGVDLSAIFETKEQKNKENLSGIKKGVKVRSSILNMLAQMPGNQSGIPAESQTLQNGGSVPLLLEILERNNPEGMPKFFKEINSPETPYDLNVLYNVLLNKNIDDQTKIRLVQLLVLKYNANITNVPTFTSNLVKKTGNTTNISLTTFKKIEFLVSVSVKDLQNIKPILKIFSLKNLEFEKKLKEQYGNDLSSLSSISNKNSAKTLMQIIDLLREKNAIMAVKFDEFLENYYRLRVEESVAKAQIYALVEQSPNLTGVPPQSNLVKRNVFQTVSPIIPGKTQMQPPGSAFSSAFPSAVSPAVTPLNLASTQPAAQLDQSQIKTTGFQTIPVSQLQQIQPPDATLEKSFGNRFNRFKFWKKGNNVQAAAQENSQSNLRPVNMTLPQAASKMSPSINSTQKPKGYFNGLKRSLFGKKNNNGQSAAQPAPLSSSQSISLQSPILNTTSSGLSQTVSPLSSPPNLPLGSASLQSSAPVSNNSSITTKSSASPQTGEPKKTDLFSRLFSKKSKNQAGGKQIQMRTYHFLKHKKYSERAFIAERPIIAADNAYDFMKLHYDIGSKKITFTIHDRVNNKKYKYTARTLKDGTNVIKSAK